MPGRMGMAELRIFDMSGYLTSGERRRVSCRFGGCEFGVGALRGLGLAAGLAVFALAGVPGLAVAKSSPAGELSSSTVSARLTRVEQQLADLQVMVGTLESLVKQQPSVSLPQETDQAQDYGSSGGSDDSRVAALETQVQALTSQIGQMNTQIQNLQRRLASGTSPASPAVRNRQAALPQGASPQGTLPPASDAGEPATWNSGAQQVPAAPGSAAMDGDRGDDRAGMDGPAQGFGGDNRHDASNPLRLSPNVGASGSGQAAGALASVQSASGAKQLYDQGYGALLRQDYASAANDFRQLVDGYPVDPLAGRAQYWLAMTYYDRGRYKDAAKAFLTGYRSYSSSDKAPDSLLGLGMSLAELGQKGAACSTYAEFNKRFLGASKDVRDQVEAERRKIGCGG